MWLLFLLNVVISWQCSLCTRPGTLIFIGLDPVIIGTKHNFQSLLWLSFLATAGANYSRVFQFTANSFVFLLHYLICNHLGIFFTNKIYNILFSQQIPFLIFRRIYFFQVGTVQVKCRKRTRTYICVSTASQR